MLRIKRMIAAAVVIGLALTTGAWLPHGTPSSFPVGFYVAPATGNDSNSGTSPSRAWATLAPVASVAANSSVYLACGALFQPSNFSIPQAGMTFGPYNPSGGTTCATPPTFDASTPVSSWTQGSGQSDSGVGIFNSGFETTSFTDWSGGITHPNGGTSTITQSTAQVYLGTYSMAFTGDGSPDTTLLTNAVTAFAANTSYAFRFFVYVPSGSMKANSFFRPLVISSQLNLTQLQSNASGVASTFALNSKAAGGSDMLIASGSLAGLQNSWVEIDIVINTSASVGGGQLWINGVSAGSNFTLDNSGTVGATSYSVGNNSFAGGMSAGQSYYMDNFVFAQQSTMIGPVPGFPTTVWRAAQASNPLMPVFPANTRALVVTSPHAATAPGNWYWDGSAFLYVYGPGNPGSSVGIPTNTSAITINGKQNVTLGAITIKGSLGGLSSSSLGGVGLLGNFSGLHITSGFIAENNYENGVGAFENTALIQNVSFVSGVFRNNGASGYHFNVSFLLNNYFASNRSYQNCSILTNATSDLTFCGGQHVFSENANNNGNSAPNAGQGTVMENNWSYNNGVAGQTSSAIGVGFFIDTVNGYTLRNNNAYGNQCDGIHVEKNGSPVVYMNNIWGNSNVTFCANLNVITSGGQNASNGQFFNNTVDGQGVGYYCISANPYQGLGSSLFNSNAFTNNISVGCTQNVQQVTDPGADNSGGKGSGNTYTFNNFGAPATNFLTWASTNCSTYACFASAGGAAAANNISGDPMFTNPTASPPDFSLQMGSPAIGASVAIPGYIAAGTNLGSNFAASN